MDRRVTGVGSSPTLPNKSEKTRLWKKLRKLDRKLSKMKSIPWSHSNEYAWIYGKNINKKQELDRKRKQIRLKLKGYNGG